MLVSDYRNKNFRVQYDGRFSYILYHLNQRFYPKMDIFRLHIHKHVFGQTKILFTNLANTIGHPLTD